MSLILPTMANQLGSSHHFEIDLEVVDDTNPSVNPRNQNHQQNLLIILSKRVIKSFKSLLTNFHAGYFRISLSLGSQALLWKTLIGPTQDKNTLRHILQMIHPRVFIVLWSFALFSLIFLSLIYFLRCLFYFNMVKAEFLHHVGVNYLFVPSISWLLLLQSSPFLKPKTTTYLVLWWVFAIPVFILDVKLYGQWFTKGKRFLSMVANPTSQLSVIGNLVGAQAAARMEWNEISVCLFTLGMVHYLVLFVTLYQRLSGNHLPAALRPVFFLFIAAPSVASLVWQSIAGTFDTGSKMLFYLSLFLFMSLICRPFLFKRSMRRFNVAWWAYSFPLTALASASIEYAQEVKGGISHVLMLLLLALSILVCLCLTIFTLFNTKLFLPDNDPISILLHHLPTTNTTVEGLTVR